jgi:hypothetical protein
MGRLGGRGRGPAGHAGAGHGGAEAAGQTWWMRTDGLERNVGRGTGEGAVRGYAAAIQKE